MIVANNTANLVALSFSYESFCEALPIHPAAYVNSITVHVHAAANDKDVIYDGVSGDRIINGVSIKRKSGSINYSIPEIYKLLKSKDQRFNCSFLAKRWAVTRATVSQSIHGAGSSRIRVKIAFLLDLKPSDIWEGYCDGAKLAADDFQYERMLRVSTI